MSDTGHTPGPLVLLAGHCGADNRRLAGEVRAARADVRVEVAGGTTPFEARLDEAALVLVNRVPEGWFGSSSGIDLVRLATERGVKAMLVSNLAEAQAEAQAAGALPGFGKSELGGPRVAELIRRALVDRGQDTAPS